MLLDELVGDAYLRARPEGGSGCIVERRRGRTARGRLDFYYFVLIVVLIFIVNVATIDVFVVPDCIDVRLLGLFIRILGSPIMRSRVMVCAREPVEGTRVILLFVVSALQHHKSASLYIALYSTI